MMLTISNTKLEIDNKMLCLANKNDHEVLNYEKNLVHNRSRSSVNWRDDYV
jgi:hypothetical protein